jgi:hypothetical protein
MFLRFVTAALRFRRRRLVLAFSALAVAATLATAGASQPLRRSLALDPADALRGGA